MPPMWNSHSLQKKIWYTLTKDLPKLFSAVRAAFFMDLTDVVYHDESFITTHKK